MDEHVQEGQNRKINARIKNNIDRERLIYEDQTIIWVVQGVH